MRQSFINETLHPDAQQLLQVLTQAQNKKEHGDPDFYTPLEVFRKAKGWSDEKTADVYARIEEYFTDAIFNGADPNTCSQLSLLLWQTSRYFH